MIETPRHDLELPDRDSGEVANILGMLQERLTVLQSLPSMRHVAVFKNRGPEAGTSLDHPHCQIVALNFQPAEAANRVRLARRYLKSHGNCTVCSLLAEPSIEQRIFARQAEIVALAPSASLAAGEVILAPLHHAPSFALASREVLDDLAVMLLLLLRAARQAWDDPAYNLVLETAPPAALSDPALHWYWRFVPRLTRVAGFEIDTGVQVNPLDPFDASAQLRQALSVMS